MENCLPVTEEIHSNCWAVGVDGVYKDLSPFPPILSEIYEETCSGCSLQPRAHTEIGSIAEAPYWGARQQLLFAFLPKYKPHVLKKKSNFRPANSWKRNCRHFH